VLAWGDNSKGQCNVPALPAGLGYVEIAGGDLHMVARVGPASTYATFGSGCPGSLPATRLVPLDTPRIGGTLQVRLFDLPVDAAFLITGWSNTISSIGALPLALAGFGMPTCTGFVSQDAVVCTVGANHQAVYSLPIPNLAGIIGQVFHQQALVLDPGAGNAIEAVMSDAVTGVVGG